MVIVTITFTLQPRSKQSTIIFVTKKIVIEIWNRTNVISSLRPQPLLPYNPRNMLGEPHPLEIRVYKKGATSKRASRYTIISSYCFGELNTLPTAGHMARMDNS